MIRGQTLERTCQQLGGPAEMRNREINPAWVDHPLFNSDPADEKKIALDYRSS